MKVVNGSLQVVDFLLELLLEEFHLLNKLDLVFFQLLVSFLHDGIDFFGRAEDDPAFVQFVLGKSVVELF